MNDVPQNVLELTVGGVNLTGNTLREQLSPPATLLVFLRHFGCMFCREMVSDIRKASEARADFPATVFVYQGTEEDGKVFFDSYWPGVRAIADAEKKLYAEFDIQQASFGQIFSPPVWSCGLRALRKGHTQNPLAKVNGDAWMMPGMFLIRPTDGRIVWQHAFKHAGDHPDLDKIRNRD